MATIKLVVDMGSSYTRILRHGKSVVLEEASLLLMEKGRITAVGNRAKKHASGAEERFLIAPIESGVVANSDFAGFMLHSFLARVLEDVRSPQILAVFAVPCGITQKERAELQAVAFNAGISKVFFVPKVVAMAGEEEGTLLCLDIGGGKTDIAIVKNKEIVSGITLNLSVDIIDNAIIKFVSSAHRLEIDKFVAENIREQIASLLDDGQAQKIITVKTESGEVQRITISANELLAATVPFYNKIVSEAKKLLSQHSGDIKILATGKGARIAGFTQFFERKLEHPVTLQSCFKSMEVLGKMLEKDKISKKKSERKI